MTLRGLIERLEMLDTQINRREQDVAVNLGFGDGVEEVDLVGVRQKLTNDEFGNPVAYVVIDIGETQKFKKPV